MEISKAADDSVRIKLKKVTIVTDPTKKIDADVVLITNGVGTQTVYDEYPLVIEGPGEYEKNGVSIKGEKIGGSTSYQIYEGDQRIHFSNLAALEKLKEEPDIDVLVVRADSEINERIFSAFASSVIVVYGTTSDISLDSEVIKKMNKINLKNREEFRGNVVILDA